MPNPQDQRVQQALLKVRQQFPNITGPIDVSPSENLTSNTTNLTPIMTTNTNTNKMSYNPNLVAGMPDVDLENTLAHELTHIGQNNQNNQLPWYQRVMNMFSGSNNNEQVPPSMKGTALDNPYYWNPKELEAFQTEKDRNLTMKPERQINPMTGGSDIYLPPENINKKKINTAPSF